MTKDEAWKIIGICERWNTGQASISDDPEVRKAENNIYNARRAALAQAWRVIGEQEGEIERLRTECNEQARLLGISGSREAKLMADIETLRKELAEANSFIESLANACEVAEARAIGTEAAVLKGEA